MPELHLKTRRAFLRDTMIGGAMTWTVPSFIQATMQSLFTQVAGAATAPVTGKDHPILVVVQLAGGNDGLNTVIPFGNDHYHRARPVIGIKRSDTLKLNDELGLHAALTGLKDLYDDGSLAIIQGVGYPNPNRSHFRSTEIWHTASDAHINETQGWIGRYFDNQCRGEDASCGIAIEAETPQAFAGATPKGITFGNTGQFRFMAGGGGRDEQELFNHFNNTGDRVAGASISSFSSGRGRKLPGETMIDFLERTAMDAQVNSDRIRAIAARAGRDGSFPSTRFGREMQIIANLITGGMPTRIYYASQGGYDTHANQAGSHERLLGEFSEGLHAFMRAMKNTGNQERVMVMTFSEFGRRVAENESAGTDHGAAAPVFIAGGNLTRGIAGEMPDLDPGQLDRGDMRHTIDFRSVYATLLERHLNCPSEPVLHRAFPLLKL
ncbi:MAG: DUF1501 domain-containing protein [Kiritimatiellia bacterium]